MAIFSLRARMICRSKGKSSVAKAAYIGGLKLQDSNTWLTHDYGLKKDQVIYSKIIAPTGSPLWAQSAHSLWNSVEQFERRKDAQTARELIIALPKELDKEQNIRLINEYVQHNFVDVGMIADINFHDKENNPHAHILLTTRPLSEDKTSFSRKKNREWNSSDTLKKWRINWQDICNKHLKNAGLTITISHESYRAQKVKLIPMLHVGYKLKESGIKFTINQHIKRLNKRIEQHNLSFFKSVNSSEDLAQLKKFIQENIEQKKLVNNKKIIYLQQEIDRVYSIFNPEKNTNNEAYLKNI